MRTEAMKPLFTRALLPLALSAAVGAALPARPVQAAGDIVWSASAGTGVPEHDEEGRVHVQTVTTSHGVGLRLRQGGAGSVRVRIPVTAPAGSAFNAIYLRAEDNVPTANGHVGYVHAALYRQPLGTSGGPQNIGAVSTTNAIRLSTDGFQMRSAPLTTGVTINPNAYSYYIVLTLVKTNPEHVNITAYDVKLGFVIE